MMIVIMMMIEKLNVFANKDLYATEVIDISED